MTGFTGSPPYIAVPGSGVGEFPRSKSSVIGEPLDRLSEPTATELWRTAVQKSSTDDSFGGIGKQGNAGRCTSDSAGHGSFDAGQGCDDELLVEDCSALAKPAPSALDMNPDAVDVG